MKGWSGNDIWQYVYVDVDDGNIGARYKLSDTYDDICELTGASYIQELIGRKMAIKKIGTLKITRVLLNRTFNQIVIKTDLIPDEVAL